MLKKYINRIFYNTSRMHFIAYILIVFVINSSFGQDMVTLDKVKCGFTYKENYDLTFYSLQAKDTISGVVTMDFIFEQDKNILFLIKKEVFMVRIQGEGKVFFKNWIKINDKTKLVEEIVLPKLLKFCICWNENYTLYKYNNFRMNFPFKIVPLSDNTSKLTSPQQLTTITKFF